MACRDTATVRALPESFISRFTTDQPPVLSFCLFSFHLSFSLYLSPSAHRVSLRSSLLISPHRLNRVIDIPLETHILHHLHLDSKAGQDDPAQARLPAATYSIYNKCAKTCPMLVDKDGPGNLWLGQSMRRAGQAGLISWPRHGYFILTAKYSHCSSMSSYCFPCVLSSQIQTAARSIISNKTSCSRHMPYLSVVPSG